MSVRCFHTFPTISTPAFNPSPTRLNYLLLFFIQTSLPHTLTSIMLRRTERLYKLSVYFQRQFIVWQAAYLQVLTHLRVTKVSSNPSVSKDRLFPLLHHATTVSHCYINKGVQLKGKTAHTMYKPSHNAYSNNLCYTKGFIFAETLCRRADDIVCYVAVYDAVQRCLLSRVRNLSV